MDLEGIAGVIVPAATMIAAMMTAANLGARATSWGFVVFALGSVCWALVGSASGQANLLWTNLLLVTVNMVGAMAPLTSILLLFHRRLAAQGA